MNAIITELFDLIARGILLLGAAFVGSLAIRRCSAALVSCYWRVAIVSALLLPLVPTVWTFKSVVAKEEILAPVVESIAPDVAVVAKPVIPPAPDSTPLRDATTATLAADVGDPTSASATLPPSTPDTSPGWFAPLVVIGLWFLGALVVMGRWAVGVIRFRRLCREATPTGDAGLAAQFRELAGDVGLRRSPELLTHPRITIPMAGGLLRSRVLLPLDCARWPESDRAMVLVHELVHVRRRDALFHLLSSFAKAIHLVNPFAWIAVRSMRDAAERATDDRVLERQGAAPSYARLLVEFASRQMATPCPSAPAGASSMAQPATVESRVHRILDPGQSRERPRRIAVTSLAGVFALLLAGVGGSAFGEGDKPDSAPAADGKELREKLESLIVPRVDFEGASLAEAVDFCTRKSREIDPDEEGVNIIAAPFVPSRRDADPAVEPTISLKLSDIPLGELLDYMATLSGRAIDIETHSVVFRGTQSYDLHTNIYPVDGELMESVLTWANVDVDGGAEDPFGGVVAASSEPQASARHWLQWAGVVFPEGSSAFFEPFGSKLIVRNTRENLKLVDLVMRSMAGELDAESIPNRAPIAERMRERVIPVIDFTEATLDEAVDYLRSQSGDSPINLIVTNRGRRAEGGEEPRISLQLRDVPFEVALKYVSEFAGLTYRIDPHAVVIRSAWDEGLQLHTFPIPNERLRKALGAEGGIGPTQQWLSELGVSFPDGAAAYFEPAGGNLIVRSNPAAIELIEKVLASIAEGIEVPMPREVGPPVVDPPGRLVPANRNLPPTELKLGAVPNVMQFDPVQLAVKAGAQVELTFSNPSVLPHNFLLLAPESIDVVGGAANRMLSDAKKAAKLHYIPEEPEIKELILAHTKVLQRGGSETIKFVAPAEPGTYPYICTFPGHWILMRGQLVVEP